MARCRVWAAGRDRAFRTEVMNALGLDPGSVGFLVSTPQIEEASMRGAEPPDVVIVHPEMERDIWPTVAFIGREYPDTAVMMWSDIT